MPSGQRHRRRSSSAGVLADAHTDGHRRLGAARPIDHPASVPAVYQLLGFPGTGKYTVAQAIVGQLADRGEPAALLDNHATANLL
jgi:adenylylsulfate kinase-like enzyme